MYNFKLKYLDVLDNFFEFVSFLQSAYFILIQLCYVMVLLIMSSPAWDWILCVIVCIPLNKVVSDNLCDECPIYYHLPSLRSSEEAFYIVDVNGMRFSRPGDVTWSFATYNHISLVQTKVWNSPMAILDCCVWCKATVQSQASQSVR